MKLIILTLLVIFLTLSSFVVHSKPKNITLTCQFNAFYDKIISDLPKGCSNDIIEFYKEVKNHKYPIEDVLFLATPPDCPSGYHSKIKEFSIKNKNQTITYKIDRFCFK